jgi:hypothetical protein
VPRPPPPQEGSLLLNRALLPSLICLCSSLPFPLVE